MRVRVLGSGAWQGIPAAFCSCRVCALAIAEPHSINARTRPQLYFDNASGHFLLEASPDIRLQSTRWGLGDVADFVVSHSHFDHMRGLAELHTFAKSVQVTVHCSERTANMIRAELSYLPLTLHTLEPFQSFKLQGFTITPFPLYHEFGVEESQALDSLSSTFGYVVESDGEKVAYLADYYRVPDESLAVLHGATIVIADGTYLGTDAYESSKRNHLHGARILELTNSLGAKKVFYHSVSHLAEKTHDELQAQLPASHELTHDGMWLL